MEVVDVVSESELALVPPPPHFDRADLPSVAFISVFLPFVVWERLRWSSE